jgi:hypothetical protein
MDMLELIIVFILGAVIGSRLTHDIMMSATKRLLQDLGIKERDLRKFAERQGITLPETPKDAADELTVVEITLEQQGNQIFAYRKDDSTFLGQGHDKATLIDAIAHRMKDVRLVISEEDGAELLQKSHT